MEVSEQQMHYESDSDGYDSDDTQDDPSFDVLEETRLTFSNFSIKKKMKAHLKGPNEKNAEDPDLITKVGPDLSEPDYKTYETVQKIIEGGGMQKLKVDQCKIYLRKHGLRLSGNKGTLIQRIKEHIEIINGGGESIYPASSFLLNCKGDACMGDVVMFEQNVYELFNIASRGGNGTPCGTRIVAGRIVKESYGAAKQQHTFTIEVLWSKGEKPLPPLHPLLIKGRNLYRLKTLRQKWEDEGERHKILLEKHTRGGAARLNREARIQKKELHKTQKLNREIGKENRNRNRELDEKGKHEESRNKQHKDYSSANCHILGPFPRQYCEEIGKENRNRNRELDEKGKHEESRNKQHKDYSSANCHILGPFPRQYCEEIGKENRNRNRELDEKGKHEESRNKQHKDYSSANCHILGPFPRQYCEEIGKENRNRNRELDEKGKHEESRNKQHKDYSSANCHIPGPFPRQYCEEIGKENRNRNRELDEKGKHEESRNKQHKDYSSANSHILGPFPRQYCEEIWRPSNHTSPFHVQSHTESRNKQHKDYSSADCHSLGPFPRQYREEIWRPSNHTSPFHAQSHTESRNKQHKDYSSANCHSLGPFPRQYCEEIWRPSNHTSPFHAQSHTIRNPPSYSQQNHAYHNQLSCTAVGNPLVHEQKKMCRYYPQGRCYFGDRCRYLHK